MNNEFNVEFNEIDIETFKELIKGKGIRHFKLESDLYGVLDVVLYEEYQKLQQRIDKAIEILKDTSVEMPETLLIETIDYARHILKGSDK